jgi:hypothetical protein
MKPTPNNSDLEHFRTSLKLMSFSDFCRSVNYACFWPFFAILGSANKPIIGPNLVYYPGFAARPVALRLFFDTRNGMGDVCELSSSG